ncbi:protein rep [Virgibacillus pantothenticus]
MTYNEEHDDYHPHFRVLIVVKKSYFTDKDYYINHDCWLEL